MEEKKTKKGFDYDIYSEKSIFQVAESAVGSTIKNICEKSPLEVKKINVKDKGLIGNLLQKHLFGLEPNSSPKPDFEEAGIELKVIPLDTISSGLTVKERTKVCSIDYGHLIKEKWASSHAYNKLKKVLFIYYVYNKTNKELSTIKKADLWSMGNEDELIIRKDWETVQQKVIDGLAHSLTERLSKVLAASRTGSGGVDKNGLPRDLVPQPNKAYEDKALKRAFSLKQSFTKQRWNELNSPKKYESIIKALGVKVGADFELELLKHLHKYDGMTLGRFAEQFNVIVPNGKNAAATIVKKAIGFKNVNSRIKEFEQLGMEVRVVPVRPSDKQPWEAISFPSFKLKEFIDETWEDSSLSEHLNRILFIPVYRDMRFGVPVKERTIGKAFFWSPTPYEERQIISEWEMYQREVKEGKAKPKHVMRGAQTYEVTGLSKQSQTNIIHIRPHGRDRFDRDEDHLGNSVVKQSFWLNSDFLQELIVQS